MNRYVTLRAGSSVEMARCQIIGAWWVVSKLCPFETSHQALYFFTARYFNGRDCLQAGHAWFGSLIALIPALKNVPFIINPLECLDRSCMHNNNCWQLLYKQLTNSYHKQLWFTVIQSCRFCFFALSYYYCPYSPLTTGSPSWLLILLSWQVHAENLK